VSKRLRDRGREIDIGEKYDMSLRLSLCLLHFCLVFFPFSLSTADIQEGQRHGIGGGGLAIFFVLSFSFSPIIFLSLSLPGRQTGQRET